MNITLRPDITWVGCVDWTVRDFHGYDTSRGTTYNAYLIRDTRTALIDAVKGDFAGDLLRNIATALAAARLPPADPAAPEGSDDDSSPNIDYVVCNHAEPDHSGALVEVMRAHPRAVVVCDAKCRTALAQHFDTSAWTFHIVADGDTLSLGRRTLRFYETPMVHWPESMFTYVSEDRLLFSMDAFGQHYASSQRFDDEAPLDTAMAEAKTYYANIVMPYGKAVAGTLAKLAPLPIDMIAPSHGVIWRSHAAGIVEAYRSWTVCRAKPKVLVLYDTMWESTRRMAEAILEGAAQPGIDAQLISIRRTSLTQIAAEVLDAAAVAIGSATLNRSPMPAVAAALSYLGGLRPTGKAALSFGSYGWGPGGPEAIDEAFRSLGWDMTGPPLKAKYRPTAEVLQQCRAAGRRLADEAGRRAAAGSASL